MAASLSYSVHQYGSESDLQRVGVWQFDQSQADTSSGYWVIYIHGGGWRDPRIAHETFTPTIDHVQASPAGGARSSIAAFASIDYRLSAHPDFPQDPAATPATAYRNAAHPDHVHDVWAALSFLQRKFGFGGKYVLIGHSAGGTLVFQPLMGSTALQGAVPPSDVTMPAAIIGFGGIYDLNGLNERVGNSYTGLFAGAFGDDKSKWDAASPGRYTGNFKTAWNGDNSLAVLGASPADELIDIGELETMAKVLQRDGVRTLVFRDLEGKHDEVWENGTHVARLILRTLEALVA